MNELPTTGQVVLCLTSAVLLAAAGVASIGRASFDRPRLQIVARLLGLAGAAVAAATLAWHSAARGSWLPLQDNFDALIWLSLMLSLFLFYVQHRHPVGGLDWFVMPLAIGLLVGAALFGTARPHEYVTSAWSWVHRVAAFGGIGAFCVAGAAGALYLIAYHRLRSKAPPSHGDQAGLASLERAEGVSYHAATLGFVLMTIALLTGLVIVLRSGAGTRLGPNWMTSPKVLLTTLVWLVYALVLHAPINPAFRGRRSAMLSILGLVLTFGTVVAVQFMRGT